LAEVGVWCIAIFFIYKLYHKWNDEIVKHHDEQEEKDRRIKVAYEETQKYPEYRRQSIAVQKELHNEIQETRGEIQEFRDMMNKIIARLEIMEEHDKRRERNQLRDKLLQSYNYYTSPEKNPSQSWTNMEAEAFWELYKDYEDAGGNGFMKSTVKPAMEKLHVIEVYKK